jgi:hypothetical protein
MDDDLGLSEREKELKKWNAPYRYREFPKMVFRGATTSTGRVEYVTRVVDSASEETEAHEAGWVNHPQTALEVETARQAAIGTAAAERAWDDRHLSPAAQAEAAGIDATQLRHVPEMPTGKKPKIPPRTE